MRLLLSNVSSPKQLYHWLCTAVLVFGFFLATASLPVAAATPAAVTLATNTDAASGVVSITGRSLNVRSGPGTTFNVIGSLANGAQVQVVGKNEDGGWLQIKTATLTGEAWVFAPAVVIDNGSPAVVSSTTQAITVTEAAKNQAQPANPTAAPAAATDSAKATAVTQPAKMNVRGGPGTNYNIVTSLAAGTALEILALNPAGDWYQVQVPGLNDPAWVLASLTTASGPIAALPHLSADKLPAAPVAAAAAAPVAPAPANAPPPAGGGAFAFGITANMWQNDKGGVAAQIKDIGFSWVKQQVRWEFVENEPGAVNWSEMDDIINVMNGNGIQVMFSVVTAPQWTRPDKAGTGGPPNDFNLYAGFVGKIAARYCGRLSAIEVWNEENLQREWDGYPLDPASYMDLLRRSYGAIKASCPAILVISGAPTPTGNSDVAIDDIDYLRGMYNNGLARYSDGIGVHPSGYAIPPDITVQDWQQGRYTPPPSHFNHRSFYFRSTMEESRQVMVAFGDSNKRLWPTEFGWGQTVSPHPGYEYEAYISEAQQAQYIVTAFRMMQNWGWVGGAFLWNLNYNEGEMAAFRVAGRPAYEALKGLTR